MTQHIANCLAKNHTWQRHLKLDRLSHTSQADIIMYKILFAVDTSAPVFPGVVYETVAATSLCSTLIYKSMQSNKQLRYLHAILLLYLPFYMSPNSVFAPTFLKSLLKAMEMYNWTF